jgi:hypothetical protein
MNDAMDGAMDGVEDTENADKVYMQICDEIGVDMGEDHVVGNSKIDATKNVAMVSSYKRLWSNYISKKIIIY